MRSLLLCVGICISAFGQGLPDRDELVEKLLQKETAVEATRDLVIHYQLGGIRTVLRSLGDMPLERRLDYAQMFQGMDLFRFRNDLNTNLTDSKEKESQALFLMLMSSFGRKIDRTVFEKYAHDEEEALYVRLAAATALVKFQKPSYYDLFVAIADEVEFEVEGTENAFRFADISAENVGFYYYVQTKINKEEYTHGHVITALSMTNADSQELYKKILKLRQRKYVPLMINQAVEAGGVELLNIMMEHKTCKKHRDEIQKALPAAEIMAKYRDQLFDLKDPELYPIRPLIPFDSRMRGLALNRSYAIVKVQATGETEIVEQFGPFSSEGDALKQQFENMKTFPAYLNWEPVESLILVKAP